MARRKNVAAKRKMAAAAPPSSVGSGDGGGEIVHVLLDGATPSVALVGTPCDVKSDLT
jgi:hypothetical protein